MENKLKCCAMIDCHKRNNFTWECNKDGFCVSQVGIKTYFTDQPTDQVKSINIVNKEIISRNNSKLFMVKLR